MKLEEAIFLSLYSLEQKQVIALPISAEGGRGSFESVHVSVVLRASAITASVLPVMVLEDVHSCHRYTNDLRNILGWLQPNFVDMGALVTCTHTHAQTHIHTHKHRSTSRDPF